MAQSFDTGLRPEEIDPARPRPVETPWGTMALYSIGGQLLCSQAFCPHLAGPLFQGTVSPSGTGHAVSCPWHRWRFDLRTGARLDPPGPGEQAGAALSCCAVTLGARGTIHIAPPRIGPPEP